MLLHQEITQAIIDAYFVVYNKLGYGFTESIYARALQHELVKSGHRVDREVTAWFTMTRSSSDAFALT